MFAEGCQPPAYGTHQRHSLVASSPDIFHQLPPSYTHATSCRQTHPASTYSLICQSSNYQFHYACPHCLFKCLRNKLKAWSTKQKKPYTAVTVQIDRLTSEQYEENDLSGIPDLVEVIRIQDTGPTEAARAIRKKLYVRHHRTFIQGLTKYTSRKYGNMHRQLRALTILDGLIQNAGTRFQRTFADEPLLERLRLLPRDEMVDPDVRAKCNALYRQWAVSYKNTQGLHQIATLYKQLPQSKRPQPSQSRVIRETEAEATRESPPPDSSPTSSARSPTSSPPSASWTPQRPPIQPQPTSSSSSSSFFRSSKDKKTKHKPFNLEKEKHQILETIASANVASTNLINSLKLINRENQRVSDNPECTNRFESCKKLRRQILRYIQLVESEQYIGSLLAANDELVKALMTFEVMDKSIDDDSDSDPEYQISKAAFQRRTSGARDTEESLAGLSLNEVAAPPKPPRPTKASMPAHVPNIAAKQSLPPDDSEPEEEDEDDPFADRNAVKSSYKEDDGLIW